MHVYDLYTYVCVCVKFNVCKRGGFFLSLSSVLSLSLSLSLSVFRSFISSLLSLIGGASICDALAVNLCDTTVQRLATELAHQHTLLSDMVRHILPAVHSSHSSGTTVFLILRGFSSYWCASVCVCVCFLVFYCVCVLLLLPFLSLFLSLFL
jgi:hypothetical protein